jgi:hypothetical protein
MRRVVGRGVSGHYSDTLLRRAAEELGVAGPLRHGAVPVQRPDPGHLSKTLLLEDGIPAAG